MRTGSPSLQVVYGPGVPKQSLPDGRRDNRQSESSSRTGNSAIWSHRNLSEVWCTQQSIHEGKRWWRSVNEGGWAVVDNGKESRQWRYDSYKCVLWDPSNPWYSNVSKAGVTGDITKTRWSITETIGIHKSGVFTKPSHINQPSGNLIERECLQFRSRLRTDAAQEPPMKAGTCLMWTLTIIFRKLIVWDLAPSGMDYFGMWLDVVGGIVFMQSSRRRWGSRAQTGRR
jgi:hypothetical protein